MGKLRGKVGTAMQLHSAFGAGVTCAYPVYGVLRSVVHHNNALAGSAKARAVNKCFAKQITLNWGK